MATLVDILASGGGGPAFNNPFGQITEQMDAGTKNAIALGGQYLQAKELEANVQYHKAQLDEQWQQREDNAWNTLFTQSANGANSKQLQNIVDSIDGIKKMRGTGSMSDEQKKDLIDTFSANPDFGAKAAQFQSMLLDSVSSGKPLDPDHAQLYREIRSNPGIANATRTKEIEASLQNYMNARGQEMRSNVTLQGRTIEDAMKELNTNANEIGKQNIKGDPNITNRVNAIVSQGHAAMQKGDMNGIMDANRQLLTLNSAMGNPIFNATKTQQENEFQQNQTREKNQFDTSQMVKASGDAAKEFMTIKKEDASVKPAFRQMRAALDSGNLTAIRQAAGQFAKTIEGTNGQLSSFKINIAVPTTASNDLKKAWAYLTSQQDSIQADPSSLKLMKQSLNNALNSYNASVADHYQSMLDSGIAQGVTDPYTKKVYQKGTGGLGDQVRKEIQAKRTRVGADRSSSGSNMITMPSGRQYTPDQIRQLLPQMNPDARAKWEQHLNSLGQ